MNAASEHITPGYAGSDGNPQEISPVFHGIRCSEADPPRLFFECGAKLAPYYPPAIRCLEIDSTNSASAAVSRALKVGPFRLQDGPPGRTGAGALPFPPRDLSSGFCRQQVAITP